MRITIIQGAFLPVAQNRGGPVEKTWFDLGREFARRGHEVEHISRLCDDLPAKETIDGVRHYRVRGYPDTAPGWRRKWRDYLYTRRAAKLVFHSDVVVANTYWAPRLLKPKRHGPIWIHVPVNPQGQMKYYARAVRIQTVSGVIARLVAAQAAEIAVRTTIIPNPLPAILPPSRPVARDPNLVLFVGRMMPEKGVELLIEAMILLRQHRPEARLRVVGPWEKSQGGGGAEYMLNLLTIAAPLEKHVEFIGPVKDEAELSALHEEAAVFAYPLLDAHDEPSPLAPLAALAHGLPVVVSDLASFDEYLQPGPYVHRFNHNAASAPARLAGVLERILVQPAERSAVAPAARARAELFSVERIAQQYIDAFANIARASA